MTLRPTKGFPAKGPRIVAIGGGTGLSTLLRGLKVHTSDLTAIVTVADDGGSSGVLREALGIPAVGDIRNCIAALADDELGVGELLQYRFPEPTGTGDGGGVGGHAVGNLLLAAVTALEGGDFEAGVRRLDRIFAVRGQVVPVTATPLVLHARRRDGSIVEGQSRIMRLDGIDRVWISPDDCRATGDALSAIAEADVIVIGPGSLYTSILPNLLVPGIRDALLAARGLKVYACNVATQAGETAGMTLAGHVDALVAHTTPRIVDVVLANERFDARVPDDWTAEPVRLDWPPHATPAPRLVLEDVVDPEFAHHHDPARLAAAILRLAEASAATRRGSSTRTA